MFAPTFARIYGHFVVGSVFAMTFAQSAGYAQQPPAAETKQVGEAGGAVVEADPKWTPEQLQVIERSKKFDEAFGKGDLESMLSLFSPDIRIVDENGGIYEGLEEARGLYQRGFDESPGATIRTVVDSIHFITPDVAVEDGTSVMTPTAGDPVQTTYQAVYARKEGQWKLSQLRDYAMPVVRDSGLHSEYLAVLQWIVGEWVYEGPNGVVDAKAVWVDDENGIEVRFSRQIDGAAKTLATVRIGYDPRLKQIKSWTFDSAGGHGTSTWGRVGDEDSWLLKNDAVMPDGKTVTTSQLFELDETGDKIYWTTFDKAIDGVISPNREEVVLTRRAPAPAAPSVDPARAQPAVPGQ